MRERHERERAALIRAATREWVAAEVACASWQTPPAECKVIDASPAQMHALGADRGVAEVDRSRILMSRLSELDVLAPASLVLVPGAPEVVKVMGGAV